MTGMLKRACYPLLFDVRVWAEATVPERDHPGPDGFPRPHSSKGMVQSAGGGGVSSGRSAEAGSHWGGHRTLTVPDRSASTRP
ncbi:hypothetical protein GCM10009603_54940 [Nocardiopsis exhalans]